MWRDQLRDTVSSLFDSGIEHKKEQEADIKSLQEKIDKLTIAASPRFTFHGRQRL